MPIEGLQGPPTKQEPPVVDVPACIKITCQKDLDELHEFLKKIVELARKDWEKQK